MAACARPLADCVVNKHGAAGGCPSERRIWSTDEYLVMRTLGEGSFGVVVLARHRHSGEEVAVKSLHAPVHAATVDELLREARFLAVCTGHPSLVALKAVAVHSLTGELSGLVMEYVGPSLHDVLYHHLDGAPLPEAVVRRIMRQLLCGAKHMHARHVVHRDIKPKNILVGEGGFDAVKICDLGLAMSLKDTPPYGHAGTTPYKAPEMLLGKPDYDGLVDMWSIGCVMAELLGGKPLFHGPDETAVLCRIFSVLGVPSYSYWPAYASLPFAYKVVIPPGFCQDNLLREYFPEIHLSEAGFDVMRRLLSCNPDKRLSATMALRHPWFSTA